MPATDDLIELLSRRHDLLRALREEPRERHELVDHVDASKSTVYRGVSRLADLDLVESTEGGLRPTVAGALALDRYDELAGLIDGRELLGRLSTGDVDPVALVGAEVVTPDDHAVDRHLRRVDAMIERADALVGFTPAISPDHAALFVCRVDEGGLAAEFVLAAEVVEHLRRDAPQTLEVLLAAEDLTLWETATDLPFTLLVAETDGETVVGIEPWDGGAPTGLVVNDTPDCVEWAASTVGRCKQSATRITG